MTHAARRLTQKTAAPNRRGLQSRKREPAHPLAIAFKFLINAGLTVAAFAFVGLGGADATLRAMAFGHADAMPTPQHTVHSPDVVLSWNIDVDADGVADFANPTHGGIRATDAFGSGDFGAVRDAGKRKHEGVDYVAAPGALVHAPISGRISHFGLAYGGDQTLRYVEITNPQTGMVARVLYIDPSVVEGDEVIAGDRIGAAQNLEVRYPGITNHVHVEIRDAEHAVVDASAQLPSAPIVQAGASAVPDSAS